MAKPRTPNQKNRYSELNGRLNKYVALVEQIYETLNGEAAKAVTRTDYSADSGKPFKWANYPQTKKSINDLQDRFVEELHAVIYRGTSEEWKNSNEVQDLLANRVLKAYDAKIDNKERKVLYQTNSDALKAFQERKDKKMNLSAKLWNQSEDYKKELEAAISCAIQKGTSAITLSKQVSRYLQDFPSLQKDYTERYGKASELQDCEYRSIRLARSEINMAYRKAENERWKQMDFVVGFEIKPSPSHDARMPDGDVCDTLAGKYPKDFEWTGWHPNCYSDDSMVLTNNGWKLFKDVCNDDLILSLNPETRSVEWTEIVASQCYPYKGVMEHFFNKHTDCLVTPDHRMVYLKDGEIEACKAQEFHKGKGSLLSGYQCENRITVFDKQEIPYDGNVYDLTLEKNHIMYVCRNGKCFWGSNCMCYKVSILKTEEEFWDDKDKESVNQVNGVPEDFEQWVRDNRERIEAAKERGTLPYFIRDNEEVVEDILREPLPQSNTELPKKIADSRKEYNSYDKDLWNKEFFDKQTGGYVVVDVERANNASTDAPRNEQAKYKKEFAMTKVFAENGHRMVMLREIPGISSPDVTIDGVYADLKQTSSANNIVNYAKKAVRKQGAELVLFELPTMNAEISKKLSKLAAQNIHGKYYIAGEKIVHDF